MRLFKNVLMGVAVITVMMVLTSISFAKEGLKKAEKFKMLMESAEALSKSNPELSAKLTQYVTEEKSEKVEKGKKETGESKVEQMKRSRVQHIKLFREAAAALKTSHPKLAHRLTAKADHLEEHMKKVVAIEKEDKKETSIKK